MQRMAGGGVLWGWGGGQRLELSVGQTMAAGVSPLPSWPPGCQGLSVLLSTWLLPVRPPLHGQASSEHCCRSRRGQTPSEQPPSPLALAGTHKARHRPTGCWALGWALVCVFSQRGEVCKNKADKEGTAPAQCAAGERPPADGVTPHRWFWKLPCPAR